MKSSLKSPTLSKHLEHLILFHSVTNLMIIRTQLPGTLYSSYLLQTAPVLTSPQFSLKSGSFLTVLCDVGDFIGPQKCSLPVPVNSVTHRSVWSGLVLCYGCLEWVSPMLVSPFQQSLSVTRLTQGTS